MGKLYDICQELDELICIDYGRCVNPETGEILDIEAVNALNIEKDSLIKYFCQEIQNDKADIKAIDDEIKRLQQRKKSINNHQNGLKNYVTLCLKGEKWKKFGFSVYYMPGRPSCDIPEDFDVENLPEEFIKRTAEPKLNELLKALQNGLKIDGVGIKMGEKSTVIR